MLLIFYGPIVTKRIPKGHDWCSRSSTSRSAIHAIIARCYVTFSCCAVNQPESHYTLALSLTDTDGGVCYLTGPPPPERGTMLCRCVSAHQKVMSTVGCVKRDKAQLQPVRFSCVLSSASPYISI